MSKNGFKVIDCDLHLIEPGDMWERYLEAPYRARAPKGISKGMRGLAIGFPRPDGSILGQREVALAWSAPVKKATSGDNHHYEFAAAGNWDGQTQLQAMAKEGIDACVLYPSRGLFVMGFDHIDRDPNGLDPEFAAALARAYNNWLADFRQPDPVRMQAAAMLAPHDVSAAVEELRRCVTELGFCGVFLLPGRVNERHWHDPYYDPLWQECERLNVPATFHGGIADRLKPDFGLGLETLFQWHTFSHCLGPMYAMNCFIGGGVFDRFPKLRAAFLEANCSWAPWMIHRMDEEYGEYTGKHEITLERNPRDYFLENCFVAVESDEKPVKYVVEEFGNANIIFSTDYPHPDTKFPHGVESFLKLELSDESRKRILWDNTIRLFNLKDALSSLGLEKVS